MDGWALKLHYVTALLSECQEQPGAVALLVERYQQDLLQRPAAVLAALRTSVYPRLDPCAHDHIAYFLGLLTDFLQVSGVCDVFCRAVLR